MTTARDLLSPRLAGLHQELLVRDEEMRGRVPDAVHQARVTCRRLRATLGTFGPLLDPAVSEPPRAELRWTARALGEARDTEVVHARLRRLVEEHEEVTVDGPVLRRMDSLLRARDAAAQARVVETTESDRYAGLLTSVGRLVQDPPWLDEAEVELEEIVPTLVRADRTRLDRRVARAAGTLGGRRDEALHAVRRAAKRLRYACESVEPAWRHDAGRMVDATARITRALGERQDTVVSRRVLDGLAASASAAGESTRTYELLHSREEVRAGECEAAFEAAWPDVSRPELWAWLR
jgi:CHAD domain-containing protein